MYNSIEGLKASLNSRAGTNLILSLLLLNKDTRLDWGKMSEEEVYGLAGQYNLRPEVFLQIVKDLNRLSEEELDSFTQYLCEDTKSSYTGAIPRFELALALHVCRRHMNIASISVKKRNVSFGLDITNMKIEVGAGVTGLHTRVNLSGVHLTMERGKEKLSVETPISLEFSTQYARSPRDWFQHLFQQFANDWTAEVRLDAGLLTDWKEIKKYLAICQFAPDTLYHSDLRIKISSTLDGMAMTESESASFIAECKEIKTFTTYEDQDGYVIGLEYTVKETKEIHPIFCVERKSGAMVVVDSTSQVWQRFMLSQTLMNK